VVKVPRSAKIITIITGLRDYNGMVMTKLSIPRNPQTSGTLHFSAEFVKITQVKTEITKIQNTSELNGRAPRTNNQAYNKVDKGKQAAEETKAKTQVGALKKLLSKGKKAIENL
jgi:hypothetical protein